MFLSTLLGFFLRISCLQEIIPIIAWETSTFTIPQLGLLVFLSVALFPILLLPSSPSMWIAGMTFGYGYGFLLITLALAVGISLPFCIGSLFLHKIQSSWRGKLVPSVSFSGPNKNISVSLRPV
ncbi:hypothetical protein LINPERHAP1_LOCUS3258 [Linum perenne]